jgi:hypothetical protein
MSFTRVQRRHFAALMVGVLLLVQGLLAAHACMPVPASGPAAAALAPCHDAGFTAAGAGQDEAPAGLCQAHCEADSQAPAGPAVADLSAQALGGCMVAAPVLPALAVTAAAAAPLAGAPPGWPPLYLFHRVLRN